MHAFTHIGLQQTWLVPDTLLKSCSNQGVCSRVTSLAEESLLKVKERNRAHAVFTEFGERNDCVLLYLMGARHCGVKVSPVDTGHSTIQTELNGTSYGCSGIE